nr:hypothetical protein [Pluralibacter sp.]
MYAKSPGIFIWINASNTCGIILLSLPVSAVLSGVNKAKICQPIVISPPVYVVDLHSFRYFSVKEFPDNSMVKMPLAIMQKPQITIRVNVTDAMTSGTCTPSENLT